MSDDTEYGAADGMHDLREIEALLRELDVDDLEPADPPPAVWRGITQAIDEPLPATVLQHRSHTRRWMLAAAAAVVAIAAAVVIVSVRGDDSQVVSTAVLVHDPAAFDPRGADAAATANLIERAGHYEIELADAEFPALADDDLELWLIEPDEGGNPVDVQPVALIEGSQPGSYRVPDNLDPTSHFVVDISIEPRDGDAAHSGQSILRGPLEPA
jgi:anti-sigma-K factor RskA